MRSTPRPTGRRGRSHGTLRLAVFPVLLSLVVAAGCARPRETATADERPAAVKRERAVLRAQKRQLRAELDSLCDLQSMVGQSAAWQRNRARLAAAQVPPARP